MLSQLDQLDCAASYIRQLKERIGKLQGKKEQEMSLRTRKNVMNSMKIGSRLPVVDLRDLGSTIEVILISGLQKNFMLYEVISILHEEGAEVVSASFSTVGDKVFHTIHAQVLHPKYTSLMIKFSFPQISDRISSSIYIYNMQIK